MGTIKGAAMTTYPVRLGVDDAGSSVHTAGKIQYEETAFFTAMADLGLTHLVFHVPAITGTNDNSAQMAAFLQAVDKAMRAHGMTYVLNNEAGNWTDRAEFTPGVDEFAHPGGAHRWDFRIEWLEPLLHSDGQPQAFRGVVYDEPEHMLLSGNKYANSPADNYDAPYLANVEGMSLDAAYARLMQEATRIRCEHYQGRVPLMTEQVWPDLFHLFAASGWTICPKLLKENISPVIMSIALGAAVQYADQTSLHASPDLWYWGNYPGHSVEALRSALLMGYWLGVETLYVENLDFAGTPTRHPDTGGKAGSLLHRSGPMHYELTPYGRVVQWFAKEYVSANPRPITWKDYRPEVAIIRLPDGAWGQFEGCASRDRLLGIPRRCRDEVASEWLNVWPILTHGHVKDGAISYFNPAVYPQGSGDFFVPINSVAVFDHLVTGRVLDSANCFVVCGHALSEATFQAIRRRVAGGAPCIITQRLYTQYADGDLPGPWTVINSFDDPRVKGILQRFLGPENVARFRFESHIVDFLKTGQQADRIDVHVRPVDAGRDA